MDDQKVCDILNAIPIRELAQRFVEALPDECQNELPGGGFGIDPDYVGVIAEGFQSFIASAIAMLLDAGSERDAVMENDKLADVLEAEVRDWQFPIRIKNSIPNGPADGVTGLP